jgi:hypothetical protein
MAANALTGPLIVDQSAQGHLSSGSSSTADFKARDLGRGCKITESLKLRPKFEAGN